MQHTTTTATTMDPHVRNTMSIMAWGMAALCAWVLLLAAYARSYAACDAPALPTYTTQTAVPPGQ
jgi:hypothetical protein